MPSFRKQRLFRVPSIRLVPALIAVVAVLLVVGLGALAVINPKPPLKSYEVTISK